MVSAKQTVRFVDDDAAFLDYKAKQIVAERDAQLRAKVKVSLSESASSNAQSILTVLQAPPSGQAPPIASRREGITSFFYASDDELDSLEEAVKTAVPRSVALASAPVSDLSATFERTFEDPSDAKNAAPLRVPRESGDEFVVDVDALLALRHGQPLPTPPTDGPNGPVLRRLRGEKEYDVDAINTEIGAFASSSSDDDEHDDDREEEQQGVLRSSSVSQVGWGRLGTGESVRSAATADDAASSSNGLPLSSRISYRQSHCHDLARLFNTLKSNDVISVEAEEDVFNSTAEETVFRTKVTPMKSLSDRHSLQSFFSPSFQSPVVCSTFAWRVTQGVLSAILSGKMDLTAFGRAAMEIQRLQSDLERTTKVLRARERDAVHAKQREARLQRQLEAQMARRNEHAITAASTAIEADQAAMSFKDKELPNLRGLLGYCAPPEIPPRDDLQWLEEMRMVFAKMGEIRRDQAKMAAFDKGLVKKMSSMNVSLRRQSLAPSASQTSFAGLGPFLSSDVIKRELLRATGKSTIQSALLDDLESLQRKKEERRALQAVLRKFEVICMEAEDSFSAANQIIGIGEGLSVKLRDVVKILTDDQRRKVFHRDITAEAFKALMLAKEVVCPLCRFVFDCSKPAGAYKEEIQRKTDEAAVKAQQLLLQFNLIPPRKSAMGSRPTTGPTSPQTLLMSPGAASATPGLLTPPQAGSAPGLLTPPQAGSARSVSATETSTERDGAPILSVSPPPISIGPSIVPDGFLHAGVGGSTEGPSIAQEFAWTVAVMSLQEAVTEKEAQLQQQLAEKETIQTEVQLERRKFKTLISDNEGLEHENATLRSELAALEQSMEANGKAAQSVIDQLNEKSKWLQIQAEDLEEMVGELRQRLVTWEDAVRTVDLQRFGFFERRDITHKEIAYIYYRKFKQSLGQIRAARLAMFQARGLSADQILQTAEEDETFFVASADASEGTDSQQMKRTADASTTTLFDRISSIHRAAGSEKPLPTFDHAESQTDAVDIADVPCESDVDSEPMESATARSGNAGDSAVIPPPAVLQRGASMTAKKILRKHLAVQTEKYVQTDEFSWAHRLPTLDRASASDMLQVLADFILPRASNSEQLRSFLSALRQKINAESDAKASKAEQEGQRLLNEQLKDFSATASLHRSAVAALEARIAALTAELAKKSAELAESLAVTPEMALERSAKQQGEDVLKGYFMQERRKTLSQLRSSASEWLSMLSAPETSANEEAKREMDEMHLKVRSDVQRIEESSRAIIERDWAGSLALPIAMLADLFAYCHYAAKFEGSGAVRRKTLYRASVVGDDLCLSPSGGGKVRMLRALPAPGGGSRAPASSVANEDEAVARPGADVDEENMDEHRISAPRRAITSRTVMLEVVGMERRAESTSALPGPDRENVDGDILPATDHRDALGVSPRLRACPATRKPPLVIAASRQQQPIATVVPCRTLDDHRPSSSALIVRSIAARISVAKLRRALEGKQPPEDVIDSAAAVPEAIQDAVLNELLMSETERLESLLREREEQRHAAAGPLPVAPLPQLRTKVGRRGRGGTGLLASRLQATFAMIDDYERLQQLEEVFGDVGEVDRVVPLPAMAARSLPVSFRGGIPPSTITGLGDQNVVELVTRPPGGLPVGWDGGASPKAVGQSTRIVKATKMSSLLPL